MTVRDGGRGRVAVEYRDGAMWVWVQLTLQGCYDSQDQSREREEGVSWRGGNGGEHD